MTAKMSPAEIAENLSQVAGWTQVPDRDAIHKTFSFPDYWESFLRRFQKLKLQGLIEEKACNCLTSPLYPLICVRRKRSLR